MIYENFGVLEEGCKDWMPLREPRQGTRRVVLSRNGQVFQSGKARLSGDKGRNVEQHDEGCGS